MRKRMLDGRKGITLIEVIIAAGISAIVLTAAIMVLTTGIKTYNLEFNSTVDQQGLRSAMITISKQVRSPSNTVAITGTKVLTVNSKNFSVSSGSLVYDSKIIAKNISAVSADYTDTTHKVIQVDLTSAGGNTLSAQIQLN
jgi:type II secretory pathway pseudopilin PulG